MARVTITVDDEHLPSVGDVAEGLRASGLEVDQVLSEAGVITGVVPDDALPGLSAVQGVASVDPELGFQIAPPDSPIQ